ncbi:MAG: hypothetical protein IKC59_06275 [Clostridia bacterium]|nr:hypothetical protein [Clostridia bacterium]
MFTFSNFTHKWGRSVDYKVYVNGTEIPVYACRVSAYPFNRLWPGHQRAIDQTELASYVNLISDEPLEIRVEPLSKSAEGSIMIKPYSKGIKAEKDGNQIVFTVRERGGYVLEIDDYHGFLYIFNNRPTVCKAPEEVTHYFGAGVHFVGKLTLKSNESVYVDKDALVYGCLFAEQAENIRIYGNGVFDDSGEERFCEPCYESYTNGNLKLYDCKNVRIEGVGFTNSAVWCINLFHCFDVEIDSINVFGQWRYNTDGVDVVNSRDITVKNSFIHSFDDAITVKGIDRYSYECNRNMLFEHCVLWCDWGKTCEIGLETAAREYENIIFRDCDILRAGNTACDIQNGDCAEVHDITFENIRVELESFYTPYVVQRREDQIYDRRDEIEIAKLLSVKNKRYREKHAFLGFTHEADSELSVGDKRFAGIHDIMVKDIYVHCDEKIMSLYGTKCVILDVSNTIPTTEYRNITVSGVYLNGKPLTEQEIDVRTDGILPEALEIN